MNLTPIVMAVGSLMLAVGGLALVIGVIVLVVEWTWRTYRTVRGMAWLMRAMQHYRKIEKPPYDDEDDR